jgi:hypothetical protein
MATFRTAIEPEEGPACGGCRLRFGAMRRGGVKHRKQRHGRFCKYAENTHRKRSESKNRVLAVSGELAPFKPQGLAHLCTTTIWAAPRLAIFEAWAPETMVSAGFSVVVPNGIGFLLRLT